jgi:hypothetical protein
MLLAAQRVHHRRLEALAECQQLVVGPLAARATQDRDTAVAVEQRRETFEIPARRRDHRCGRQQPLDLGRRRIAGGLQRHVTGQHEHRHAAPADGLADRDLEGARRLVRARHELAEMAALLEQELRMGLLKIAAADLGRRDLRGDAEHGHARAVAVEQSVDEVQVARSAAAGADGELAAQMRLGPGRERGDLLVPYMDPLDLALAADGVSEPVQAVADDAVDPLDARSGERLGELICDRFCHRRRPLLRGLVRQEVDISDRAPRGVKSGKARSIVVKRARQARRSLVAAIETKGILEGGRIAGALIWTDGNPAVRCEQDRWAKIAVLVAPVARARGRAAEAASRIQLPARCR